MYILYTYISQCLEKERKYKYVSDIDMPLLFLPVMEGVGEEASDCMSATFPPCVCPGGW